MMDKFHAWKAAIVGRMKDSVSTLSVRQPVSIYLRLLSVSALFLILHILRVSVSCNTFCDQFGLKGCVSQCQWLYQFLSPDCSCFVGEFNGIWHETTTFCFRSWTIQSFHPLRCEQKILFLLCFSDLWCQVTYVSSEICSDTNQNTVTHQWLHIVTVPLHFPCVIARVPSKMTLELHISQHRRLSVSTLTWTVSIWTHVGNVSALPGLDAGLLSSGGQSVLLQQREAEL